MTQVELRRCLGGASLVCHSAIYCSWGRLNPHDWRRTWLLSNFLGPSHTSGVCPNPLPLRKCPLRVALWFFFHHLHHHHHPISWERLKLGNAPMGEKETCLLLCVRIRGRGWELGGSAKQRKETWGFEWKQIYKQSINWKWEKWGHFTLCLLCFTSFTPAFLYFNTFLAYEMFLLRYTFVPLCF